MTTQQVFDACAERGITLRVDGEQLLVTAPRGAIDAQLGESIRANKPEIIAILRPGKKADFQFIAFRTATIELLGHAHVDIFERFRALAHQHYPDFETCERIRYSAYVLLDVWKRTSSDIVRANAEHCFDLLDAANEKWRVSMGYAPAQVRP